MDKTDPTYYVHLPGHGQGEQWDKDKYDRNKEELFNDHPDAMVWEMTPLAADADVGEDDEFVVHLPGYGQGEVWDKDKYDRNREQLLRDHPDVEITRAMKVNIHADRLNDIDSRIAQLNDELKGMPKDDTPGVVRLTTDQQIQDAKEAALTHRRRKDIERELDELYGMRENNPLFQGYIGYERQSIEESQARIDRLRQEEAERIPEGRAARQSALIKTLTGRPALAAADLIASNARSEAVREYSSSVESLAGAKLMLNEAGRIINAPSRHGEGGGFWRAIAQHAPGSLAPAKMLRFGLNMRLTDAVRKIQQNEPTGEDTDIMGLVDSGEIDKLSYLNPGEKEFVKAFAKRAEVEQVMSEQIGDKTRSRLSRGYQAGQSFGESIGFMVDFMATGGIGEVAARAALGGLAKKAGTSALRKIGAETLYGTVKALAMTPLMPSSYYQFQQNLLQFDDAGGVDLSGKAIAKAAGDVIIENISETVGSKPLDLIGLPLSKVNFPDWAKALRGSPIAATLKQAGYNGLFEEIAEEWTGNALRVMTGVDKDALRNFATVEQQLITLGSFAPMSLLSAPVTAVQYHAASKSMRESGLALEKIMGASGMSDTDVKAALSLDDRSTPEELASHMADVYRRIVDAGGEAAEAYRAVADYTRRASTYKVMTGVMDEQKDIDRSDRLLKVNSQVGSDGWYHTDDSGVSRVRTITDSDGVERYVTAQDADGNLALVGRDGGTMFLTAEDYRNGIDNGTLTDSSETFLSDYLDRENETVRRTQEATRVATETAERTKALLDSLEPGLQINVGTVESPSMVTVLQVTGGRVIVQREDGTTEGYSPEEIAGYTGVDLHAKTDDEIEDESVRAEGEKEKRRKAVDAIARSGVSIEHEGRRYNVLSALYWVEDGLHVAVTNEEGETGYITLPTDEVDALIAESEAVLSSQDDGAVPVEDKRQSASWTDDKGVLRDINGNAIPLKEDGSVNENVFWNESPEAWAAWNDEKRQDGGVNTLGYIAKARAKLAEGLQAIQTQMAAETDHDRIAELERQAADIRRRDARYEALMSSYANREADRYRQRVAEWEQATGVRMNIIERPEDIQNEQARMLVQSQMEAERKGEEPDGVVKGWYVSITGEVYIYLPNIQDERDIDETVLHEIIGHKGLRELLGKERHGRLMDRVWSDIMSAEDRKAYLKYVLDTGMKGSEEELRRAAADEYVAAFAEKMMLDPSAEDKALWDKFVDMVAQILAELGIRRMTREDLSNLLAASLANYRAIQQKAEATDAAGTTESALKKIPETKDKSGNVTRLWHMAPDVETGLAAMREAGFSDATIGSFAASRAEELAKRHKDRSRKKSKSLEEEAGKTQELSEIMKELSFWRDIRSALMPKAKTRTDEVKEFRGAEEVKDIAEHFNAGHRTKGATTVVILANGTEISGHYELVEAGDAVPSHNPDTFAPSDGFPVNENGSTVNDRDYEHDKSAQEAVRSRAQNYDKRAYQEPVIVSPDGVVLSGNDRTMSGILAANNGTDAKYIESLRRDIGQFGMTEQQMEGYRHPRVIFVTDERLPYTTETFAMFNANERKSQSATEKMVKAGKVTSAVSFQRIADMAALYESVDEMYRSAGRELVNLLVAEKIIGANDAAAMLDGDRLSQSGREFVEGLITGYLFNGNDNTVRMLMSEGMGNVRKAIVGCMNALIANRTLGEYSLQQEIEQAIELCYRAHRDYGGNVEGLLRQRNLFTDDSYSENYSELAGEMALAFNSGSVRLREGLDVYNRSYADESGQVDGLFGKRTRDEAVKTLTDYLTNKRNGRENTETQTGDVAFGNEGSGRNNAGGGNQGGPADTGGTAGSEQGRADSSLGAENQGAGAEPLPGVTGDNSAPAGEAGSASPNEKEENTELTDSQVKALAFVTGKSEEEIRAENDTRKADKEELARLDREYVEAVKSGDADKAFAMLREKALKTDGIIPYIAPAGYAGSHRDVARQIKEGEDGATGKAASDMARFVPGNAVLVPMPDHTGKVTDDTDTKMLAEAVSALTGSPVVAALEGRERESRHEAKQQRRKGPSAEELGFRQVEDIPEGMIPVFIDNVVDSGETAKAATQAIGGGFTLAYAKGLRSNPTKGLKDMTVTYDDNGSLIPLSQRFDKENPDIRFRFQGGGKTLFSEDSQLSLFSEKDMADRIPGNSLTTGGQTAQAERPLRSEPVVKPLRKLREGETCLVERRMTRSGNFLFTSGEKIETTADIAYIFRSLENKAVENAFLVFYGGEAEKAVVLHVGMGALSQSAVDTSVIVPMLDSIKPARVALVHNHPSGNLKASREDVRLLNEITGMVDSYSGGKVKVDDGIIIDTTSGMYGTFNTGKFEAVDAMPGRVKNEVPLSVYKFDENAFSKDYNPQRLKLIRSPQDVAQFVATHRLGERSKINIICLNGNGGVVGNFFSDMTELSAESASDLARECARYCGACSASAVVVYGTGVGKPESSSLSENKAGQLALDLRKYQIRFLDAVSLAADGRYDYMSYREIGLLGEPGVNSGRVSEYSYRNLGSDRFVSGISSSEDFANALAENESWSGGTNALLEALKEHFGGEVVAASGRAESAMREGLVPVPDRASKGYYGEYHHLEFEDDNGERFVEAVPFVPAEDVEGKHGIRFRVANTNQAIFVSNAERAVEGIRQDKATPDQWLAMLQKQGGIKAGEDKWLGLSDWLESHGKKSLTKQEVMDFINENKIQIEEVRYGNAPFSPNSIINLENEIQRAIDNGETVEDVLRAWDSEFDDNKLEQYQDGTFTIDEDGKINTESELMLPVNHTRLNYTTKGLDNKREIALVVPTIEPWNEYDEIHFGDAGEGRAVAWIRFGDTEDDNGKRTLFIDEIQSKRHQEGREKGYLSSAPDYERPIMFPLEITEDKYQYHTTFRDRNYSVGKAVVFDIEDAKRYLTELINDEISERNKLIGQERLKYIPDAPFEKNWHELAMKRMLRLAAEEGYDKVAWTTGEQQAERYDLGHRVSSITATDNGPNFKRVMIVTKNNSEGRVRRGRRPIAFNVSKEDGTIRWGEYKGQSLGEVLGKELAVKIMQSEGDATFDLRIGGEGMKGFYDEILPRFMDKYGKKWGVKTEEALLRLNDGAMLYAHAVDVTPEMRESVMEGQTMFRIGNNDRTRELNAKQKRPGTDYGLEDASETIDDIRFRLSNRNRRTVEAWLKKRSDLSEAERQATLGFIDGVEDGKTQLACGWWFAKGTIRLPEDMPKVEQAVAVSAVAKVDPLRYSSPMELINAHAEIEIKEKPVNPDEVDTLHKAKELPDGIVVYDVDDSEESRRNMRRIINTHFGKESSPWCLLQGDGNGNLTEESRSYWDHYNSYPKQVAFKDGRLLAFSANDDSSTAWWDRTDNAHDGIPVTDKIPGDGLGRSATFEYDPGTGSRAMTGLIFRGNRKNGLYEEWDKNGNLALREKRDRDGNLLSAEKWYENGQMRRRWYYDSLIPSLRHTEEWYANGQLRQRGTWNERTNRMNGPSESWYENGQEREFYPYDENGKLNGTEIHWNEDGGKTEETVWVDNIKRKVTAYFRNGEIKMSYELDEEERWDGKYVRYYEPGKVGVVQHYRHGEKHGVFEEYNFMTGHITIRETYKNDRLNGFLERWRYDDGDIATRAGYVDGELRGLEYYGSKTVSLTYYDSEGARRTLYLPAEGYTPMTEEQLMDGRISEELERSLIEREREYQEVRFRRSTPTVGDFDAKTEDPLQYAGRVMDSLNGLYRTIAPVHAISRDITAEELAQITGLEWETAERLHRKIGARPQNAMGFYDGSDTRRVFVFDSVRNGDGKSIVPTVADMEDSYIHENLHAFFDRYRNESEENSYRLFDYLSGIRNIAEDYLKAKLRGRYEAFIKEIQEHYGKGSDYAEEMSVRYLADILINEDAKAVEDADGRSEKKILSKFLSDFGYVATGNRGRETGKASETVDASGRLQGQLRREGEAGEGRTGVGYADSIQGKRDAVRHVAAKCGIDVVLSPSGEMRLDGKPLAGRWVNGRMHVCAEHCRDAADAVRTVLHEGVGRAGLRGLAGSETTVRFCLGLFSKLPKDARRSIADDAVSRHGGNVAGAVESYLAERAVQTDRENEADERGFWDIVRKELDGLLRSAGIDVTLSDRDIRWLMWQSRNPDRQNDMLFQAERQTVAGRLGFTMKILSEAHEATQEVRFRMADDELSAARIYNREVANWASRLYEVWVDKDNAAHALVDAIEKSSGRPAKAFEDVRLALNQQSSKGLAAIERFDNRFFRPMVAAIKKLMKDKGCSLADVERYVMIKHALERNEVFARRDAKEFYRNARDKKVRDIEKSSDSRDEKDARIAREDDKLRRKLEAVDAGTDSRYLRLREEDYGGLTTMYSEYDDILPFDSETESEEEYQARVLKARHPKYVYTDKDGNTRVDIARTEAAARDEVAAFEDGFGEDIEELWKRVNAATKSTLKQQYDSNMLSREQYLQVRDMFQYYVPLRGFADNTAEDMYDYYNSDQRKDFSAPLIRAKGRKTVAESPFGYIGAMASSGIAAGMKNETKLALYYFISNRGDNDLATISDLWYVKTGTDEDGKVIFTPSYYPFDEDMDTDEAKKAYENWEREMEELAKAGMAFKGTKKLDLKNSVIHIDSRHEPGHIIRLKVGGADKMIIINGNPRAAQAVNNELNVETSSDYRTFFGKILRYFAGINTSYNPEFWLSNLQRDTLFALMSVSVKEDKTYNAAFRKNLGRIVSSTLTPGKKGGIYSLRRKLEDGTLGDSYVERMYREFTENGGVTGWTTLKNNEEWEQEMREHSGEELARLKAVKTLFERVQTFGEAIEQMTRFAAYMTSRETGREIKDSVGDAKELTVNFNRKGSGKAISFKEADKLRTKDGRRLNVVKKALVVGASWLPAYGRRFIMFFNASVQGLNAMCRLYKKDPTRMGLWTAGFAAMGAAQAVIHALLDDDDDYLDIPDYERRNNLLLGGKGVYLKWALPQEARVFYAIGDMAVNHALGREPHKDSVLGWLGETGSVLGDIMPLNPSGGLSAVAPSALAPVVEVLLNKDYKGAKIYNDLRYLSDEERKRTPAYQKAYQGTGRFYVFMSELANRLSGGDYADAGWLNINPAAVEHILRGATGGAGTTIGKLYRGTVGQLLGEEWSVRNTPFLSRILTVNDERYRNAHTTELFYFFKAEAERTRTRVGKYRKEGDNDKLDRLLDSKDYDIMLVYDSYRKLLEYYNDQLKVTTDKKERKELMREQDAVRKEMIKEISDIKK